MKPNKSQEEKSLAFPFANDIQVSFEIYHLSTIVYHSSIGLIIPWTGYGATESH